MKKSQNLSIASLCKGLPSVFPQYLNYCRSLKFDNKPDYAQIKKWFMDQFMKDLNKKFEYDWCRLGIDLDNHFVLVSSREERNKPDCELKTESTKKNLEEEKVPHKRNNNAGHPKPPNPRPSIQNNPVPPNKKSSTKILKRSNSAPRPKLKKNKKVIKQEVLANLVITNKIKQIRADFLKQQRKNSGSSNYDSDEMNEKNSNLIIA